MYAIIRETYTSVLYNFNNNNADANPAAKQIHKVSNMGTQISSVVKCITTGFMLLPFTYNTIL